VTLLTIQNPTFKIQNQKSSVRFAEMGLFSLEFRIKNPEPREDHEIGDSSKKRRFVLCGLASLREKKTVIILKK